jgi:hypothetical protein
MRRAWIAVVALSAAGCGGGSATATPTPSPSSLVVSTAHPPAASSATATGPAVAFPAKTRSDVIVLATQRPVGKTTYKVTVSGPNAVSYTLTITDNRQAAVIDERQATGEVWVAFDLQSRVILWSCTAPPTGQATCHHGDPDGSAARTANAVDQLFGNSVIEQTFAPVAAMPGSGLGVDTQIGEDVSCLAATTPSGDARLCATKDGFITQMTSGTTSLIAQQLSRTVAASDLAPPAPPT